MKNKSGSNEKCKEKNKIIFQFNGVYKFLKKLMWRIIT